MHGHPTGVPKPSKRHLASPEALPPNGKRPAAVHVVIETPKGSRNKYKFEPDLRCYRLTGVLPEGMAFPYDFGFIPQTEADDGDPLDVLLIMDWPAFPGCVVESRLIGVIEGEQKEDGETVRNDRLIAVAIKSHQHSDLRDITQLNDTFVNDIGQFFANYNRLRGKQFKVLAVRGPNYAERLLKRATRGKKAA
jgi:inorganic pyrophosphatase